MPKSLLLALAMLPTVPLSATWAADLPKQGTDSYTTVYVMTSSNTMKLGNRTATSYETSGATRNDNGGPMFNNMGARCVGMAESVGGDSTNRGTCVEIDADGDQIFTTYEAKGNAGTHTFVGGTGKYTGISGTASYTRQAVKDPEGRSISIVSHKATWKLPTS